MLIVKQYQQMKGSANQNKIFSILKNSADSLTLHQDGTKMICKTYKLQPQTLQHIIRRQNLQHPLLIRLHHIERAASSEQSSLHMALVHEHYCRTLEQCIFEYGTHWDDEQLISTFEPVIEAIAFLNKQQWPINDFSLKNVVVTEDESIKIVDSFFHNQFITIDSFQQISGNSFNEFKIYEDLADAIYKMICPHEKASVWGNKLRNLKSRCSRQFYQFFLSIYEKSAVKTKKLKRKTIKKDKSNKKKNIQEFLNRSVKGGQEKVEKQAMHTSLISNHSGKENQLLQ